MQNEVFLFRSWRLVFLYLSCFIVLVLSSVEGIVHCLCYQTPTTNNFFSRMSVLLLNHKKMAALNIDPIFICKILLFLLKHLPHENI